MTKLDANQLIKLVYDETTGGLLTTPSSTTAFNVELSAVDGDSVQVTGLIKSSQALALSNASTGNVVPEFDISGVQAIQLYSKTLTTITGPQVLTLEVSPVATGDVWFTTTVTLTPSTTAGVVSASSIGSVVALRARVKTAAAITSGTYDLYVVGR